MVSCKCALSARSGKLRRYTNVVCCSLKIPPSSRGHSLSIVESDGVNRLACTPPPKPNPTPAHSVGFVQASTADFSFLLQVSLFLRFDMTRPPRSALADVALRRVWLLLEDTIVGPCYGNVLQFWTLCLVQSCCFVAVIWAYGTPILGDFRRGEIFPGDFVPGQPPPPPVLSLAMHAANHTTYQKHFLSGQCPQCVHRRCPATFQNLATILSQIFSCLVRG